MLMKLGMRLMPIGGAASQENVLPHEICPTIIFLTCDVEYWEFLHNCRSAKYSCPKESLTIFTIVKRPRGGLYHQQVGSNHPGREVNSLGRGDL